MTKRVFILRLLLYKYFPLHTRGTLTVRFRVLLALQRAREKPVGASVYSLPPRLPLSTTITPILPSAIIRITDHCTAAITIIYTPTTDETSSTTTEVIAGDVLQDRPCTYYYLKPPG